LFPQVDYEEFVELRSLYPFIMSPLVEMQRHMRETTLGREWWERRAELLHDERVKLGEILDKRGTRKDNWDAARPQRAADRVVRTRMGTGAYYLCPVFRCCVAYWIGLGTEGPEVTARQDIIKAKLEKDESGIVPQTAEERALESRKAKAAGERSNPRVSEKMAARDDKASARREKAARRKKKSDAIKEVN